MWRWRNRRNTWDLHYKFSSADTRARRRRHPHINRKRIERFVEIIHLNKDTERRDDREQVGAGTRKLIFSSES